MSQFFTSSGQSIGASASAAVLLMNIQDLFPLGLTGLITLQSKGPSSLLQHHSSKASILLHSNFFIVQLSHPYMATEKNIAFFPTVSPSICHEVMGPDSMILVFLMLSFKPAFSGSSLNFIKSLFSSSSLSAIRVVSSAYLSLLIFLPAILIPACAYAAQHFS